MQKTEVACDQCGADLSVTGNCEDYRIILANEAIPSVGGAVTCMAIYPPLKSTSHFCGTLCLAKWVSERYPSAVAKYDELAKRRADRQATAS
jgi:hypothetical protein